MAPFLGPSLFCWDVIVRLAAIHDGGIVVIAIKRELTVISDSSFSARTRCRIS